ncbi:MAG: hypothetical protein JWL93_392 [Hyphomicrobiales bacterium]|nr:hypothetical protein [Hyphomicrobiales bacterium]
MRFGIYGVLIAIASSSIPAEAAKNDLSDVLATVAAELMGCRGLNDDKARLQCFDTVAKKASEGAGKAILESLDSPKVEFSLSNMIVVDPADLYISPRKYVGRSLEVRNVACIHADTDDYRCISGGSVFTAIFSEDVSPSQSKIEMERRCGLIRNISSPNCRVTIRFVPSEFEEDVVSGANKRVIFKTLSLEVRPAQQNRRSR